MKKYFIILIVILPLFLQGCTSKDSDMKKVTLDTANSKDATEDILELTKEQKEEDFSYLIDTLNELYPFWGELKDIGINKEELITKYKELINNTENSIDYLNILLDFFKEMGSSFGHLAPIPACYYKNMCDLYRDMSYRKSWYKVLTNPVTAYMYSVMNPTSEAFQYFDGNKVPDKNNAMNSNYGPSDNIMYTDIINNGKTAYIRIPSFGMQFIEKEVPQIKKFIEDCYKLSNLIIDIRGNSGGSSDYWIQSLVEPNIEHNKTYSKYYLFKKELFSNEAFSTFLAENYFSLKQDRIAIEILPEFEKLSSHAVDFDSYINSTREIAARPSQYPFKGKIWLLSDRCNASAAEEFLNFCSQSDFATIVGEASGGDDCNGDPALFALPNSGLVFRFDCFYGLNPDGSCNAVAGEEPDIVCKYNEALVVCLEKINQK